MQDIDLPATFERQIAVAEDQFEQVKASLFGASLSASEFAVRRTYARQLEETLTRMHETRRRFLELQDRAAFATAAAVADLLEASDLASLSAVLESAHGQIRTRSPEAPA